MSLILHIKMNPQIYLSVEVFSSKETNLKKKEIATTTLHAANFSFYPSARSPSAFMPIQG